ncbi:hypothetical protein A5N15_02910 [Rothia kristinae]|uniref:Uncharacterized protein n=1 Tax=Rothia kristinae TaxID=37923 RepID=A0A657IVP8_9MICC|nr:hypothetical protein A5N15_02910 [Rothia kristinae]
MGLQHVLGRPRAVVEVRPALQAQGLLEEDVDALDALPGPGGLEEPVAEAQPQQGQQPGHPQEVVHPVHVLLRDEVRELGVQLPGGVLPGAQGLLHREDQPPRQPPLLLQPGQGVHRVHRYGRGQREVQDHGAGLVLQQPREVLGVGGVADAELRLLRGALDHRTGQGVSPQGLGEDLAHGLRELVIGVAPEPMIFSGWSTAPVAR